MIQLKSLAKIADRPITAFTTLAVIYAFLIFSLPANKATMRTYSISALQYKAILIAVALPSIMVWAAAFFGYTRLRQYTNTIQTTKEGPAFKLLTNGVTWLAWSMPLSSIVLLTLSAMANKWASWHSAAIIIGNYVGLLLPLIAFTIIGTASRSMISRAKLNISVNSSRIIMLFFVIAGVIYCYATFRQFDLSSLTNTNNPYSLPFWLAIVTITVPYLYAWFVGLLAAYEIALYNRSIKGVLYRQSLYLLVLGLVMVIGSLISTQYLNGLSPRVGHLVINYKLPLTTVLKILGGIGFVLIAAGAVKLKKIEEV